MSAVLIVKMTQTCYACPSQWDGWDADGTYYYFRFRHGHLRVDKDECGGETVLSKSCDGDGSYDELRDHVADVLTLPESRTQGEHE